MTTPKSDRRIDMSKHPKPKEIYLPGDLMASEAFRGLSRVSLLVLLDFFSMHHIETVRRGKKTEKTCVNGHRLVFPYALAEQWGFRRDQFRNAIRELVGRGFIDIVCIGKGQCSVYKLSDRYLEHGTESFVMGEVPKDIKI